MSAQGGWRIAFARPADWLYAYGCPFPGILPTRHGHSSISPRSMELCRLAGTSFPNRRTPPMWSLPSATGALSTVPNSTCSCVVARFAQSFWEASPQTWGSSPPHAAQPSTATNWLSRKTCAAPWTPRCTRSASSTSCRVWPASLPQKESPSDERDERKSQHALTLAALVADAGPVGRSGGALEPRWPGFEYCRAARRAVAWPDDKRHRFRRE